MRKNLFCFISLFIISIIPMRMFGQTYESLWKQVEQANKKSLPQTVIKLTEDIFSKAQKEKNSPQMLKAYTARAQYQSSLTPDSFYVDLKGMERWVDTTDNRMDRAILHTLIAGIYADYARSNSWNIRQRASLIGDVPEDIREWSGNLFVDKVMQHTEAALQDSTLLLSASSKDYQPFVILGNSSEYYRHDMFHMLTLQSINALKAVNSIGNYLQVNERIESLFTRLTRTYREQGNGDAYLLASLDYLRWKNARNDVESYIRQLDEMISTYGNREVVVEVYLEKANILSQNREYTKALSVVDEAIKQYPKYNRINAIKVVRENILSPYLNVQMPGLSYPGSDMDLMIKHKNLDGFTVEYYQVNLSADSPEVLKNQYSNIDNEFIRKYTRKLSSEYIKLERPVDYNQADTVVKLKAPTQGLYVVRIITGKEQAEGRENKLLSVTTLKMLSRQLPDKQFEVIVVDGMSGKPVENVQVRLFTDKKGDKVEAKVLTTNSEGKATTPWNNTYYYIKAQKGSDNAMLPDNIQRGYYSYSDPSQREERTELRLLTDRSLYRPGQTVYVKGIAFVMGSDTANVAMGKKFTLTLYDPNGREINKNEFQTNDFGSFTTEIVLPSGGLNGMYNLSTDNGSTSFRVEEYKRPTFDITFDKLESSYRLGDSVQIKGTVKSYSGVYVQDVPVSYTVKRSMRGWWGRIFAAPELIASGTAQVNDTGEFTVPVQLTPDAKQKTDDGFYTYTVEATVTNVAGETQSSTTTISAGSRSLLLNITTEERINKDDSIKVTFGATNLSGQPLEVTGEYKLYPVTDYKERTTAKDAVYSGTFTSNKEMNMQAWKSLPSGAYMIKASAKDQQGREATAESLIVLFSLSDTRPVIETTVWYHPINTEFDANHPAAFIFGTSEKDTYILMDVFSGNKRIESRVLQLSDSLMRFDYPYKASYGDGLSISFCFVKNGQAYMQDVQLQKRIPDKELKIQWKVFRDKLRPGQQEEWQLTIHNPNGIAADAEMLATLYDASLDKIWKIEQSIRPYYNIYLPNTGWMDYYGSRNYFNFWFGSSQNFRYPELVYDRFWNSYDGAVNIGYPLVSAARDELYFESGWAQSGVVNKLEMRARGLSRAAAPKAGEGVVFESEMILADMASVEHSGAPVAIESIQDDIRTNFAETAFFYPQLRTNEKGEIVFSFTMPESLTRWNFRGYAHTKGMLTGILNSEVVTSKEFMLTPNLPRFVRVGDKTSVAASVSNTTGKAISGNVVFTLFDPLTDKVISTQKQKFTVEGGKSTGVNFSFTATDKYDFLGCRIVAEGGNFSDGEQHMLPVLSDKERITETVSMPIRGNETREFSLESLFNTNSKTATDRRLTVEFSGNPAWYAIQALPSVSIPENDNAISWATVFYANTLASYIMNAQPRIKTMFDTWKMQGGSKETFLSNLQKNEDVKNILLEESPWLLEATTETEQMQRIATLFDLNQISNNNITALTKLKDLQLNSGAWTWYKGMSGSRYITTYILETLVRLYNLTSDTPNSDVQQMRNTAFTFLHNEALAEYKNIREAEKRGSKFTGISGSALEYLYLVAISGEQVPSSAREAYNYFLSKLPETLTTQPVKEKALAAIILSKAGKQAAADGFMASLKEHLVQTDELGMYFAFNESPYRWNDLRIPAHVAVMEAFDIVAKDSKTVEEMKIWLLKQKQTQQWDSPVSTANAVYALLHRGSNLLENQGDVRINLNGKVLETLSGSTVPGIGYIKESYTDTKMVSNPGKITVEKRDAGIAWGAVYAQYNEDIDKVTQRGNELNVDKKLYIEKTVGSDRQLIPVTAETKLTIGDRVVSRITITLDRAMDFVQLKDQRGACFEPIGALSGYRWSNGFGYYVAVKDASTNFFFDSLGKGVYVLEYSYRVSRSGTYQAGLAVMQSAYAPEYASHSASMKVEVTE